MRKRKGIVSLLLALLIVLSSTMIISAAPSQVTKIQLIAPNQMSVGSTAQTELKMLPAATKLTVSYTSSNSAIVTIDKTGKITAKKAGLATITATSGKLVSSANIRVLAKLLPVNNSISGGGAHSLVLKNNGTVWTWGYNHVGQLGDGTTETKLHPIQVKDLYDVVQVSAGSVHNVVLKRDGTLWTWGYNINGELGDGTTMERHIPVQVKGLSDIKQIDAAGYHNLALKKDGTVWAWGQNSYGQLGDGTMANKPSPVQVKGISNVIQVSAGLFRSLALKDDGTIWIWGKGYKITPQQVKGVDNVIQVCVAHYGAIMFLKEDGTVWEMNEGSISKKKELSNIVSISGAAFHQVALKNDGTVWAWGSGHDGELGDGNKTSSDIAVKVKNLSDVVEVSAGEFHTLAMKSDGSVWAWGSNQNGQLGDDTTGNKYTPNIVANLNCLTALPVAPPPASTTKPTSTPTTTPTPGPSAIAGATPSSTTTTPPSSTTASTSVPTLVYAEKNKSYVTKNGLTIILTDVKKIENSGSISITISYTEKNETSDKKLDEETFKIYFSDGTCESQYGFFGSLFPSNSISKTYTFEFLKSKIPTMLEFGGEFLVNKVGKDTIVWDLNAMLGNNTAQ